MSIMSMSKVVSFYVLRIGCLVCTAFVFISGCSTKDIIGDVGATKINMAVENFRKWTPENIQKDPQAYLHFCEAEVNSSLNKMDASKIAINQKKALMSNELESQQKKTAGGEKMLDELKAKYKEADGGGGSFPIKVSGYEFDQEKAKRTILRVVGEIASTKKLASKLENAVARLAGSSSDLQSRKDKAKEQLAEIKVQMESLKIQDMTKDLATDLAGMTAALGGIVGVGVDDDDASATPGLEDIMANSKVSVNEDEFSDIMSK